MLVQSELLAMRVCELLAPNYDYTEAQREATWILANLTSNKRFAEDTAKRLGVGALILRRLDVFGDIPTKDSALWTLNNMLADNRELRHWLLDNGVTKLLLGMLKERLDENHICTLLTTVIRLIGEK